jgi:hypothetical protein
MNDAAEHHPLVVRLAQDIDHYLFGDLTVTYDELALRRAEKTLLDIEQYSMEYFGAISLGKDYDAWTQMHEDIGLPLEILLSQLGDVYVRVGAAYARSRDLVSGTSVDERIADLESRERGSESS